MRPIDAEDIVQAALNKAGLNACAVPLAPDFDQRLPFALVTRAGGQTYHEAADLHLLSVDVYASTWEGATNAANRAVEIIRGMDGTFDGTVQVYEVDCNMPYRNPDPNRNDLPRETFTVTIEASGLE